jgi:hypothetical protein
MGDFNLFIKTLWLIITTFTQLWLYMWKSFPVYMFLFTFGPAAIIVGSIMVYWFYKIRQINKKYRDR